MWNNNDNNGWSTNDYGWTNNDTQQKAPIYASNKTINTKKAFAEPIPLNIIANENVNKDTNYNRRPGSRYQKSTKQNQQKNASIVYNINLQHPKLMIDIGSNLTSVKFKDDINGIIDRAYKANVKMQIITGTDLKNSEQALNLCKNLYYKQILKCTVGIHPHNANNFNKNTYNELRKLLSDNSNNAIVAVGETGLDYYRMISSDNKQKESFREHIKLAIEFNKPLFLHERDAFQDFIKILDEFQGKLPPVVVHCFTGKPKELDAYISRGYYIGITGFIAMEHRSQSLQQFVNKIPLNKLMIETDAPYMKPSGAPDTPSGHMEPALLNLVAVKLSKLFKIPFNDLIRQTTQNTIQFFKLS